MEFQDCRANVEIRETVEVLVSRDNLVRMVCLVRKAVRENMVMLAVKVRRVMPEHTELKVYLVHLVRAEKEDYQDQWAIRDQLENWESMVYQDNKVAGARLVILVHQAVLEFPDLKEKREI